MSRSDGVVGAGLGRSEHHYRVTLSPWCQEIPDSICWLRPTRFLALAHCRATTAGIGFGKNNAGIHESTDDEEGAMPSAKPRHPVVTAVTLRHCDPLVATVRHVSSVLVARCCEAVYRCRQP